MTHSVLPGSSTRTMAVSAVVFNPMGEAATQPLGSSAVGLEPFKTYNSHTSLRHQVSVREGLLRSELK